LSALFTTPDEIRYPVWQNVKDGYIWRITAVESAKYTAQGWVNGKWGLTVSMEPDVTRRRYVKVQCPFSTDVLQGRR
jgi:hypothetical protein